MRVGRGPVEDMLHLRPIGHVFVGDRLHRRAGDDEAVEFAMPRILPGLIERAQMVLRRVLGGMVANADQGEIDLQGSGAEQARDLQLGLDLVRHEIEQADLQRADVLADRRCLGHHAHALVLEGLEGGELVGNLDRHIRSPKSRQMARSGVRSLEIPLLRIPGGPLASSFTWLQAGRPNHHGMLLFNRTGTQATIPFIMR